MIVLNKHHGRLCNRLWAYVPFINLCLQNNQKLLILHFDEYYDQFENLRTLTGIRVAEPYIIKKNHFWKWLFLHIAKPLPQRLLHFFNVYSEQEFWEQEHWRNALAGQTANIIFLDNKPYVKEYALLPEFQDRIRHFFRPKQAYVEKVTRLVSQQREKHSVIVGVHIRRRDYRKFRRGAYYFDDATYCACMADLEQELQTAGKSVAFLLCSDEPLKLQCYSRFNTFQVNHRADIEDLYALSLTDYIMGAPSTFSMWASFYGKVPLRILQHKNEKVHLHEFSVMVSQHVFENGRRFDYKKGLFPCSPQSVGAKVEHLNNPIALEMGKPNQQKVSG